MFPDTEAPMRPPIFFISGNLVRDGGGGERDRRSPRHEHDRRVPEREEKADTERLLALLQHEADGVVDRGDVVGVERVPQPEHVRDEAEPDQRRVVRRVVQIQTPADDVQRGDEPVEPGEAQPFGGRERQVGPLPRRRTAT